MNKSLVKAASIFVSILFIFISFQPVHSENKNLAQSYSEDFEDGQAQGWDLESGWQVINDSGNKVLSGSGHFWARSNQDCDDYAISFRLKIIKGTIHLVFRMNDDGRYFISFDSNGSNISKQYWPDSFQNSLKSSNARHSSNTWHQIKIEGNGSKITFKVDGKTEWTFADSKPFLNGSLALETLDGAQVYVDDVTIEPGGLSNPVVPVKSPTPTLKPSSPLNTVVPATKSPSGLTWVRTGGPLGGLGYDVRMFPDNPDKMLVTDGYAGIFMSRDGGKTWFPSNSGIDARDGGTGDAIPVFSVTINASNPKNVWLGTLNRLGIYKSTDGGETWKKMINGITERDGIHFRGFTIDPNNSDIVYAAAEISSWSGGKPARTGREFDLVRGVVYKTRDGGRNWKAIWRGDNLARYVWIDPRNTNVVYVSTGIFDREANNSDPQKRIAGGVGILKSTNGGETWQQINNGLNNLYVGSLFMHPTNPDILLAGTGNNQYYDNGGAYLTLDGGKTWRKVISDFTVTSVEFALSNPSIAYAGNDQFIYRSDDGGFTWRKVSGSRENGWGTSATRGGFPIDIQVDPRDADRIFINAYGGGNFLSVDGGKTWDYASKGYTGSMIRGISVDPTDPGHVYVGARSGLFASSNGGDKWEGSSPSPVFFLEWDAVAIDPSNPKHLIADSRGDMVLAQSFDAGNTWKIVMRLKENPENMVSWFTVKFAPSDPKIVYAGTTGFSYITPFEHLGYGEGVYKSVDGGTTWKPANDSLSRDAHVTDISVDPKDPNKLFIATTNHGVLASNDGGVNWRQLKGGLPGSLAIAVSINPQNPNFMAAGIVSQAVYISKDGGATWSRSASGMPAEASLRAIIFDPTKPNEVMYAGDFFSGVYRSLNGGKSWERINNGLTNRSIQRMAISADGLHLYAGTEGGGVFRLDLNGVPPV